MTTEKIVAHHQANPNCVINTPKAKPSGTKPRKTGAASCNPARTDSRRVCGAGFPSLLGEWGHLGHAPLFPQLRYGFLFAEGAVLQA